MPGDKYESMAQLIAAIRRNGTAGASIGWLAERLGTSINAVSTRVYFANKWLELNAHDKTIISVSGRYVLVDAAYLCDADGRGEFGARYRGHDYGDYGHRKRQATQPDAEHDERVDDTWHVLLGWPGRVNPSPPAP